VHIEPYLELLKKELEMYAKTRYVKTSVFDEIVLGGGTPSVLTAEQMIDLIDFCKARFNINKEYFIKVTGSSKTLALSKIEKLANYGVYQMDMGAQTFDDKLRKMLCLPDSAASVEKAIRHARKLGLCVCVDLMYNLPGQTIESWINTLKKAIELDVEIDTYSLEVYPGTALDKQIKSGLIPPPGDAGTCRAPVRPDGASSPSPVYAHQALVRKPPLRHNASPFPPGKVRTDGPRRGGSGSDATN
jgi:oxygen-independent coproporphyrinogen-3 oxidase